MRWPEWILILTLAPSAAAGAADLREVSEELVCQCRCNHVLYNCNMQDCGSAYPMREEIEAQLSRGVPKEAVVASFVERYGTKVLSAPPRRGFHWAAWLSPIVALLAGGLLAAKVLASWRRQTPLSRTEALARTPSSEQHRRIERELLEMET